MCTSTPNLAGTLEWNGVGGNEAIDYIQRLGVACMTCIDESASGPWCPQGRVPDVLTPTRRHCMSEQGVYIVCQTLVHLGYTLSLPKSVLSSIGCLLFLGMLVNALQGAFLLLEPKKAALSC